MAGEFNQLKRVFVVTGVCRAGTAMALPLVQFLDNGQDYVLAWVDFKDGSLGVGPELTSLDDSGRIVVASAPRAVWGGSSIVRSMMEAVIHCLSTWHDWEQLIFCSADDVPLVRRADMDAVLDAARSYDYCGSRWNNSTFDVLKPMPEELLVTSLEHLTPVEFQIRPEMSILLDPGLRTVFTDDLIASMRLCNHLYERYFVAVSEWFSPGCLTLSPMTAERATERHRFFSQYGLYSGRQWCMLSRKFAEIVVDGASREIFQRWFQDVLIPDESFFQTVAHHSAEAGRIAVLWRNFHYNDAANYAVTPEKLAEMVTSRQDHHLFARKRVPWFSFAQIEEQLNHS